MSPLIFKTARIFAGTRTDCTEGMYLRIADGLIQEVSSKPIAARETRVIDVGGRTLMPGLIDAHMHAYCSDVSMQKFRRPRSAGRTLGSVGQAWRRS